MPGDSQHFSTAHSKPSAQRPFLEQSAVDQITRCVSEAVGLNLSRQAYRRLFDDFVMAAIDRGRACLYISYGLVAVTAVTPFLISNIVAAIPAGPSKYVAGGALVVLWILLLLLGFFFPKDLRDLAYCAENIKARVAIGRLSGVLALHNFILPNSVNDDLNTIAECSSVLDPSVQAAARDNQDKIAECLKNRSMNWRETCIVFSNEGLGTNLNTAMNNIARSVATVCRDIFGSGVYTVKVYLTTTHEVNVNGQAVPIRLLSAMARYPAKPGPAQGNHGRSWMYCSGRRADVWEAQEQATVFVYRSVKSATENRIYETIACIPLPEGLGVVTIECNDPDIFSTEKTEAETQPGKTGDDARKALDNHTVTEEVRASIGAAVRDLVLRAIRADLAEKARTP